VAGSFKRARQRLKAVLSRSAGPTAKQRWDYEFESAFLQRRVRCELDFSAAESGAWSGKRLIKLLLRARRFNATLAQGEDIPFAVLAQREGVSRSYFTRLVRLSYLAPDITQAILDGGNHPI
jgi:site-specific DNA recombinase